MVKKIKFHEVIYSRKQIPCLDSSEPIFIKNQNPNWRELQAYVEIYRKKLYIEDELTGVLSPKFSIKSKIKVSEFINFIENSSNADVYFINPCPQNSLYSLNSWVHGEALHPGLLKVAKELLFSIGSKIQINEKIRQGPDVLCYCNFWAGNHKFWNEYVGGVLLPIVEFLEKKSDEVVYKKLHAKTLHTENAVFLPFIVERLFSTFLQQRADIVFKPWKHHKNDILNKYCTTEFERIISEAMINFFFNNEPTSAAVSGQTANVMELSLKLKVGHDQCSRQIVSHSHSGKKSVTNLISLN